MSPDGSNAQTPGEADRSDEGVLLQSRGSVFGENVYLCRRGKRHSVRSAARIVELGRKWPDDVVSVPEAVLMAFAPAGIAPGPWPDGVESKAIASSLDMREAIGAGLSGFGLEVGAGASPFPASLDARVLYGDRLGIDDLQQERYPGQLPHELVVPDIRTEFDDFSGIADDSLDFIIGCHVIEHARNPIGSICAAYRKLKAGGKLVLVVPDKTRTFDSARPTTTLDHLLLDYRSPDRARDYAHYEEFYALAIPVAPENVQAAARDGFDREIAIHYHAWNFDAFSEMLKYIGQQLAPWVAVWSHRGLFGQEHDIEFYFVLTK